MDGWMEVWKELSSRKDGGWRDGPSDGGGREGCWLLVSQTPHPSLGDGCGIQALGVPLQAALPHAHVRSARVDGRCGVETSLSAP